MSADVAWLTDHAADLDIDALADSLRSTTVVGLAPTTRESQEIADLQVDLVSALVDHGAHVVVLQMDTDLAARLQAWVHDATDETLAAIREELWGPWQIQAVADLMQRLRDRHRSGTPIEVRGLSRPTATTADYDTVLGALRGTEQEQAVADLFATIRVAHDGGEHVERAHGRWDGPPFVDLARTAADLVDAALVEDARVDWPETEDAVAAAMERIVRFHAHSLSQGHDGSADERRAADELLDRLRRTGARAVIWDGLGHLSATGTVIGARLREELGDDYRCVVTTFGSGRLRDFALPAPDPSSLDASLAAAIRTGVEATTFDLRDVDEAPGWLRGDHRLRLISGMYDPQEDQDHYVEVADLRRAVDVLVVVGRISPAA